MADLINRPLYLDKLVRNKDIDLVKIVTGLRRCGKSSLLNLFHRHLSESGVKESNIIHMNLESLKYTGIKDYLALYRHVSELIPKFGKTYLIFDEIQNVEHWEKAIESFRLDFDVDIYLTGSNAYLFSSEFATLLSGRFVEIRMLPLSFREFLDFYGFVDEVTPEEKFVKYVRFGGMPILREYRFDEEPSNQALEGIFTTVIMRDILLRNDGIDSVTLGKIVRFLCANIGSINSPNSIGNVLKSEGETISGKTVEKYMDLLQRAFFFYPVGRYDIKGKQLLKTLGKNYIVDIGFRNMLLGYRDADRGHILENIVYLELLRRGYRVYIGKVGETEVDFVAERPDEKLYVQVSESITAPETLARELKPLKAIQDNYGKIILSLDRNFVDSFDGIKTVNLIDWLLA